MAPTRRCVVVTDDPVGEQMGGMAMRASALARVLAAHFDTQLAAPGAGADVTWSLEDIAPLRAALQGADVVVAPPMGPVPLAALRKSGARLIFDLYDPTPIELLEAYRDAPAAQRKMATTLALDALLAALRGGHHFLCASERQRDLYTGVLLGAGLLTPAVYAADPSLRSRFSVVPFGVDAGAPVAVEGAGARARFPALTAEDELIVWNGGIWNWLDPVTAVRAMPAVLEARPRARLVFMGRAPLVEAEAAAAREARAVARDLGLLDTAVFFNDAWVPLRERAAWLLEAACTLSTHVDHLETRFAFRTRVLDSLWAGAPVVCTEGDELAESVASSVLGAVVPPEDVEAVAGGLVMVLGRGRGAYADALVDAAERLRWEVVAAPLVEQVGAAEPGEPLGGRWSGAARPGQAVRAGLARVVRPLRR